LRLSWPRHNDKRRAIIGPDSKQSRFKSAPVHHRLVNASSRDVKLHEMILTSAQIHSVAIESVADTIFEPVEDIVFTKQAGPSLLLNSPSTGVIAELSPANKSLFQYCEIPRRLYSNEIPTHKLSCREGFVFDKHFWERCTQGTRNSHPHGSF
jgi:hypothetical protein